MITWNGEELDPQRLGPKPTESRVGGAINDAPGSRSSVRADRVALIGECPRSVRPHWRNAGLAHLLPAEAIADQSSWPCKAIRRTSSSSRLLAARSKVPSPSGRISPRARQTMLL